MKNLSIQEREFLMECLANGSTIPEDFREKLFPTTHKEYELRYAGKMRKEDILADQDGTFAVPLQVEKIYNGEREKFKDDWRNMLVFGDNLQFLKTLYKNEDPLIKDKVKGKVKLIYIDPPFATADEFQNKDGIKSYSDKKQGAEFLEFIRKRLIIAREILSDDGSIYVHLDQKMSHYIKTIIDEIFGKNQFVTEIIWNYSWGVRTSARWNNKHDNILMYSKSNSIIFNANDVLEERKISENTANRLKYKGALITDGNKGRGSEEFALPSDVWYIATINGMSIERTGYPTQKPEALLKRIIKSSTNENDIVLDSFLGSGTTCAVAHKMNRRYIGIEMGEHAKTHVIPRLTQVINGEQGGISKIVDWQGGGGFSFYTLGSPVFDQNGFLNPDVKFADLASYVWWLDTKTAYLTSQAPTTPLLGVHDGVAYYLLYNGILGDRRPNGGNVLTMPVLRYLEETFPHPLGNDGKRVIFGEASRINQNRLDTLNIEFKQIPYALYGTQSK